MGLYRGSTQSSSQTPFYFVVSALTTLMLFGLIQPSSSSSSPNKLLLILVDGFRWDYFDKLSEDELPGFTRLRQNGVSAEAFMPVFPSLSFANYYSIMTGLYPESHGMIDNYMYDIKHDAEFLIGDNEDQYHSYWWDDGEPLWISAVKQGKRSYFWFWNGCEVKIRGHRPTLCSPYQLTPNPDIGNFSLALQQAVAVLRNDSADLAGVYVELVDVRGHKFGPDSDEVKEVVKQVDGELVRVLDALNETTNINLMVFSDHGMAERVGGAADDTSGLVNVLDYINSSDWKHAAGSEYATVLQIWPKSDNEDWIYQRLRSAHHNLTVYKKQDIPERYHYKNHYRVAPLLLEADEGYVIVRNALTRALRYVGYHGYDNMRYPNMYGIYFASGPDFKRNAKFGVGRLPNVNVYQLMCHVMQLVPAPHNGTWSKVCDALSDNDACVDGPYSGSVSMAITSRRQDAAGFSLTIIFAAVATVLSNTNVFLLQ